jgi:hypothetical protein
MIEIHFIRSAMYSEYAFLGFTQLDGQGAERREEQNVHTDCLVHSVFC